MANCFLEDILKKYWSSGEYPFQSSHDLGSVLRKVFYFSDGAALQYKNRKNFINLCHHELDFGVPDEWHFSATSHGKGSCDGVGGSVKRLAARASLQRPHQLFE